MVVILMIPAWGLRTCSHVQLASTVMIVSWANDFGMLRRVCAGAGVVIFDCNAATASQRWFRDFLGRLRPYHAVTKCLDIRGANPAQVNMGAFVDQVAQGPNPRLSPVLAACLTSGCSHMNVIA
jgi:hypothetical protein